MSISRRAISFSFKRAIPMQILRFSIGISVLIVSADGLAQATEAARYINKQGVEVIQSRPIFRSAEEVVRVPEAAAITTSRVAPSATAIDSKLQIRPREQRVRDEDRLVILKDELKKEATGFETKLRLIQTPALKAKLSPEDLARVEAGLTDHAQNVRSLNAEISRMALQP